MATKRKTTKGDYRRFIEWAIERAEEEERNAQGMTRSFLQALRDSGQKLLDADESR